MVSTSCDQTQVLSFLKRKVSEDAPSMISIDSLSLSARVFALALAVSLAVGTLTAVATVM